MDIARINENFTELVNYYNYDEGIDLPSNYPDWSRLPRYRAICAIIAWCMINETKFWEYYNKSDFWKIQLDTALRQFGSKIFAFGSHLNDGFPMIIYDIVSKIHSKKFILAPKQLDSRQDLDTIYNILFEGVTS